MTARAPAKNCTIRLQVPAGELADVDEHPAIRDAEPRAGLLAQRLLGVDMLEVGAAGDHLHASVVLGE